MAAADEDGASDGDDSDADSSAEEGEETKPKRPYVYDVVLRRRGSCSSRSRCS